MTALTVTTTTGSTLSLPSSQSHLTAYEWAKIRSPRPTGDYRTRAYRLTASDGTGGTDRMTVVTCELIMPTVAGFDVADVLDVAYPQDSTDLSDELRYGDDWAREMAAQSTSEPVPAEVAPISQIDAVPLPTNNQALIAATAPAGLVMPGQIVLSTAPALTIWATLDAGTLNDWHDSGAGVVVGSVISDDQTHVCLIVRMFDGSDRSDDSGSVWERSYPVDAPMVTARGL